MVSFGRKPRYEHLSDGTTIARAGTQANCGGIAQVRVRITTTREPGIRFEPPLETDESRDVEGTAVLEQSVTTRCRAAMYSGAEWEFDHWTIGGGVQVELIEILVHIADANEHRFREVGVRAMYSWMEAHFPGRRQQTDDPDEAGTSPS